MVMAHLIALSLAIMIDFVVGDPPRWPHPVKWFGSFIAKLDKHWNRGERRKWKGVAMLATVILVVGVLAYLLVSLAYSLHLVFGIIVEAILISTTIAQKSLKEAGLSVFEPLKNGDLAEARRQLSFIVGRDTDQLDEAEITRATVETLAENTTDGITAPLFWALFGGAPLALMYRAINTCDSMVGYKNETYQQFGWASARMDDIANWFPSRITAFCMLHSNKPVYGSRAEARKIVDRDAQKHPSPNSGWNEAAVAAILGVQLGGTNYYKGLVSHRATMGKPHVRLEKKHIIETNKIVMKTVPIFLIILWLGGMLSEFASTWFKSILFI